MKKQLIAIASIAMLTGAISFSSCKKDDTTAPTITVSGGNSRSQSLPAIASNGTWSNPSATAADDVDGDISSSITVTGTVNPNTAGTYTLTYTVSDAAGNSASQTVTVSIVNDAAFLGGHYQNASDVCTSGTYSFNSDITVSTTTNNVFVINNYAGFGVTININAALAGNSITIASNQSLGAPDFIISASGTVTNATTPVFTVSYSWSDGASTEVCNSTYTHQ